MEVALGSEKGALFVLDCFDEAWQVLHEAAPTSEKYWAAHLQLPKIAEQLAIEAAVYGCDSHVETFVKVATGLGSPLRHESGTVYSELLVAVSSMRARLIARRSHQAPSLTVAQPAPHGEPEPVRAHQFPLFPKGRAEVGDELAGAIEALDDERGAGKSDIEILRQYCERTAGLNRSDAPSLQTRIRKARGAGKTTLPTK